MHETTIGRVTHFYPRVGAAAVRLRAPLRLGDRLHVVGPHDDVEFRVSSIEIEHRPVAFANSGDVVGVGIPERVHEGSVVLREEVDDEDRES